MDGDFYVAASLATTLTKLALRYVAIVQDKKKQNVSCPSAPLVLPRQHQQHKITNVTQSFFFSFFWRYPRTCRSSSVLRRGVHAHHGHRAPPGQVVVAQEAHHRRRRGPHLAVPQGPVRVLATHE